MSIGPAAGIVGSAAGAPLAQAQGSEKAERVAASAARRQLQSEALAEKASGVGTTSEDQQAADRDADGRRPWEAEEKDASRDEKANRSAPPGLGGQIDFSA
jgi:hypothetical protein